MRTLASTSKLRRRSRIALFCFLSLCGVLLCTLQLSAQTMQEHAKRTLSGVVTDPHHEPLRGAIVKLQLGDSEDIITYITGEDGHYIFKRLEGNADYRVWVTFRSRRSKSHDISKFDDHMDKVIDFTLEPF